MSFTCEIEFQYSKLRIFTEDYIHVAFDELHSICENSQILW